MDKKAIDAFRKKEAKKDKKHIKVDRAYAKRTVRSAKTKAMEAKQLEQKLYNDVIEQ